MSTTEESLSNFGLILDDLTSEVKAKYEQEYKAADMNDQAVEAFLAKNMAETDKRIAKLKEENLSPEIVQQKQAQITEMVSAFNAQTIFLLKSIPELPQP